MKVWTKSEKLPKLQDLVDMDDPAAVFAEVRLVARMIHPGLEMGPLRAAFENTMRLFAGRYPGYRECNTPYHDRKHTTDCFMAMARLLHGASVRGRTVSPANLVLGLIAALHHDTGYIQKIHEISGTGARFTLTHVDRGIAFMEDYARGRQNSAIIFPAARDFLNCTRLDLDTGSITFESEEHELVGKTLGAADLLGQMADGTYIERLPLLYRELEEGNVRGFESALELMKATPSFLKYTKKRLARDLGGVGRFMADHFRIRWGVDRDLYRLAIASNIRRLKHLIDHRENGRREVPGQGGMTRHRAGAAAAGCGVRSKLS